MSVTSLDQEEAELCLEIERWSKEQNLEWQSADEMLLNPALNQEQIKWLGNFIRRWNDLMDREQTAWIKKARG